MTTLIHKIILGTAQLGLDYGINNMSGKPSQQEADLILQAAYEQGIRLLDTADAYGDSMDIIGAYHQNHSLFRIVTKFHVPDADTDLKPALQQALHRLHVDHVYCYMYHRFSDFFRYPHTHDMLRSLKEEQLIERVGISIYTNEELKAVMNVPSIDVIQLPYNLLDNINLRGEFLQCAKENGKEIHARSPFLQGLLFKNRTTFSPRLQPLIGYIQQMEDLAHSYSMDLRTMALNYVLHTPLIDYVLVGVETVEQLMKNIHSVQSIFDQELMKRISDICIQETELLNPSKW